MGDIGHDWTDEQIEALKKKFRAAYAQADREMSKKLEKLMAEYERDNREWKSRLDAGRVTKEQYEKWLASKAKERKWMQNMVDTMSRDASNANQLANDYINDAIPHVFAENANMAAYGIEQSIGYDTHSFDLYDQDTVRRLIAEEPELLPQVPQPKFDNGRDLRWNRQKFSSAITQSILQGESVPNAAKRISNVMRMNERAAVKVARTALTGAENAGRVHSYERAKGIGIDLEQQWIATFDNRTRHSHRILHGQHVPVGEKFKVDNVELEYPADPSAPPEYVWNCRCTLVAWFPDIEQEEKPLWTDWEDGTTYEQWKNAKAQQGSDKDNLSSQVEIAGVKKGRPMTFEEANKLRGNPNYNMSNDAYDKLKKAREAYNEAIDKHGFSSQEFLDATINLDNADREYKKAVKEQVGYRINCQTCVVANEARRRGYDVKATPNVRGSVNERVSRNTALAWIDPKTGRHPEYIRYDGEGKKDSLGRPIPTHKKFVEWLEKDGTVEEGARYTIEFTWGGRGNDGHIVCLERTPDGLRMYDPQCGETYDEAGIRKYLKRVKYKRTSYGYEYAFGPELLKVSDYEFDLETCNEILVGSSA